MEDEVLEAAKLLCQIYFEIAEELIGEDEVRSRANTKLMEYINNGG